MAPQSPREVRTPRGMNRWTFEPLILGWSWILTFGSFVFVLFAEAVLGSALAVVILILLWAAVALVWYRVWATRNRAVRPRQSP